MSGDLSQDLISAIQEGRAVLFLGAGASRGAKDREGKSIPIASDLANMLADKFLGLACCRFRGQALKLTQPSSRTQWG